MLAAVLYSTHRMTAAHRQPRKADFFRQQDTLVPKATADVGRNDPNSALLHAEAIGKTVARDVWHLGAGVEREVIEAGVEDRDDATPLEWRHALPSSRYLAGYLDRRIESRRDVDLKIGFEEDV